MSYPHAAGGALAGATGGRHSDVHGQQRRIQPITRRVLRSLRRIRQPASQEAPAAGAMSEPAQPNRRQRRGPLSLPVLKFAAPAKAAAHQKGLRTGYQDAQAQHSLAASTNQPHKRPLGNPRTSVRGGCQERRPRHGVRLDRHREVGPTPSKPGRTRCHRSKED